MSMFGAFCPLPNPDMTEAMIDELLDRAQNTDLLLIADNRYGAAAVSKSARCPCKTILVKRSNCICPPRR